MKHLHIYKQNKIKDKNKEYDLVIYTRYKRRKDTEYIVSIFGEYSRGNKGPFYGRMFEKVFDSDSSKLNENHALRCEEIFLHTGKLFGIRFTEV